MNYYGDYLGFENYGSEKDYFDEKPKSNRNYYNNNSNNTSLKKKFPIDNNGRCFNKIFIS